jgi:hypothetical protein
MDWLVHCKEFALGYIPGGSLWTVVCGSFHGMGAFAIDDGPCYCVCFLKGAQVRRPIAKSQ